MKGPRGVRWSTERSPLSCINIEPVRMPHLLAPPGLSNPASGRVDADDLSTSRGHLFAPR